MSHSDSYSAAPTHHHAFQNSLTAIINAEFVACLYRHRTALRSQTRQDAHFGAKNLAAGFLPASLEPVNLPGSINKSLLTSKKWVALGTNIDVNLWDCRTSRETIATSTRGSAFNIVGMNTWLHATPPGDTIKPITGLL